MRTILLLIALSGLVAGCDPGSEEIIYLNSGHLCLGATENYGAQAIAADEAFRVSVTTDCFSGSCSSGQLESCSVSLEDGELIVESLIEVQDASGGNRVCTMDCVTYTARCSAPALAEGEYTVRFGADTLTLFVPSDDPPCDTSW